MIQKETTFKDAQLEQAMKKIYTRSQPTEHRYFTAAPTTSDIQNYEVVLAYHDNKYYLYANFGGTIKKVELT